uniref:Uncharacterized protein n=1 Tax=Romanomermis culicivorax TaxID=13658 RepID=A0A915JGA4_ROMCU
MIQFSSHLRSEFPGCETEIPEWYGKLRKSGPGCKSPPSTRGPLRPDGQKWYDLMPWTLRRCLTSVPGSYG